MCECCSHQYFPCPSETYLTHHTAITDKPKQMQSSIPLFGPQKTLPNRLDLVEFPLLDSLIDSHNILPNNSARSNIQMSDLAVSHQSFGESNRQRRRLEFGKALSDLRA